MGRSCSPMWVSHFKISQILNQYLWGETKIESLKWERNFKFWVWWWIWLGQEHGAEGKGSINVMLWNIINGLTSFNAWQLAMAISSNIGSELWFSQACCLHVYVNCHGPQMDTITTNSFFSAFDQLLRYKLLYPKKKNFTLRPCLPSWGSTQFQSLVLFSWYLLYFQRKSFLSKFY